MKIVKVLVLILTFINTAYAEGYDFNSLVSDGANIVEKIDVNNDGVLDTVISLEGGQLLFFSHINGKDKLILETTNFTVDALEAVIDIVPVVIPSSEQKDPDNPLVMTIINGIKRHVYKHNIRYISKDNNWLLESTEYTTSYEEGTDAITKRVYCKFYYDNLILDKSLADNYSDNTTIINGNNVTDDTLNDTKHCKTEIISD